MTANPKISVIMLTYNREELVSRAIECVLAQTLQDYEFIIVNNGSKDKSGEIADRYARTDPRINVIHKERGNIGSGRNAGLNAARGEYIAFVDDDDLFEPDFLEFLYTLAAQNNADVSICGAEDKSFNEKRLYSPEEAVITLLWRKRFNVQFPTKLIRRKMFNGISFSETSKYDDIELMPKILAMANRVAYFGLPKYTFSRHPGNNSAWTTNHSLLNAETLKEYLDVYHVRTEWLCRVFPESAALWQYFQWSFWLSMVEKVAAFNLEDCMEIAGALRQELSKHRKGLIESPYLLDFEKQWITKYVPKTPKD